MPVDLRFPPGADDAPLLCFAGNDWWVHNPYTEKQWMRRIGRGRKVLFVNSIGIGMPSLSTPRVFTRIAVKFKSLLRWLRRDEGVWVLTPFVIPLWTVGPVAKLNVFLLALQVRLLLRLLGMQRPLFWAGLPTASLLLDRIPHRGSVYYIQDNYLAYYDRMTFSRVHEHHADLLARCDRVICASIGMHADRNVERDGVRYVPHGVADGFLKKDIAIRNTVPAALSGVPHPIIGYWGSLEVLQDQDLICRMAEAHPEWSLVFIGRPMYDIARVDRYPNVHFLGYVPIDDIADCGVHFDVATIPWIQSDWVKYSAPVKFREYYALGKPVVSADIIEVAEALPGARTAKSIDNFIRCVEEELASDTPEKQASADACMRECGG
ncbi:MAG: glycosyltransferase [Ignavibacteria bacterium]|nr:glycosyltransferase [Ignavibacteria bacterium]